ncbi:spore coat protein [candidate division WOR-1 bacterium RIFOXYD2_FULL_36_8]|uniref:Spore coat protein n=1 Tax=candidate division WOR-1 bacterium RIFOXYB2_FULL_36_35 TaxID=1802578 RepID=A0A1F4S5A4_UNCSA|nr:MAG: spore coat protein [candidate division WOR-1 bacterium RIFOXYA2_FULL_36_21]OGC15615.1 MAG: spore coat protein [candidate division WOR-1 bacterium RIFOXYB2_FULL_36_35]OGC16849.1 MAG: spore coat protein [candidate division WOR-1 bacterium RIFOXYA12_FULL_36_13]OGC37160.1 MAG: spore coat protein [candidate division WOR-1 bacterium RIFOXYD2_FULL_36_8]
MKNNLFDKLFIFEMANNHMGDVEHGLKIIKEIKNVTQDFDFQFAFKFQYRNLDSFIHPDYKERKDIKYVKRFSETRLSESDFLRLKEAVVNAGFITICTPFDEASVDLIKKHGYEIVKIASCSFTDWPLLERIAGTDKPIIASTAGASLENIDKVVSFFEHRKKQFALMHCVAAYPTPDKDIELNQIDLFQARYPGVVIGYSTHEGPQNFDAVKIAIAKGAKILERHVALSTDKYPINGYSSAPSQVKEWLSAAKKAYEMCGVSGKRLQFTPDEISSLRALGRGLFAKREIKKGEQINSDDLFFAIPTVEDQITANDFSKYIDYSVKQDIHVNQPILFSSVSQIDNREKIYKIVKLVKKVLQDGHINVPGMLDLEISHHYGVDRFHEAGCTLINFINREYCKKLIVLVPGQSHPEQYHQKKEETFHVLHGDVDFVLDDKKFTGKPGDIVVVERGMRHIFSSKTGAVIEEISSTHYKDDSFYTDPDIAKNKQRKTTITYWMDV